MDDDVNGAQGSGSDRVARGYVFLYMYAISVTLIPFTDMEEYELANSSQNTGHSYESRFCSCTVYARNLKLEI